MTLGKVRVTNESTEALTLVVEADAARVKALDTTSSSQTVPVGRGDGRPSRATLVVEIAP
jgi:hypothetical protein